MKFAVLVLIGFCVLTTQGYDSFDELDEIKAEVKFGSFLDSIKTLIRSTIVQTKETISGILNKTADILKSLADKVTPVVNKAKDTVRAAADKAKNELNALKANGLNAAGCISTYIHNIEVDTRKIEDQLEGCGTDAILKGQQIRDNINENTGKIDDALDGMNDIIQDCTESTNTVWSLTVCVSKKAYDITSSIGGMIKSVNSALYNATKQSVSIVVGAEACVAKTSFDVTKKFVSIVAEATKCLVVGQK